MRLKSASACVFSTLEKDLGMAGEGVTVCISLVGIMIATITAKIKVDSAVSNARPRGINMRMRHTKAIPTGGSAIKSTRATMPREESSRASGCGSRIMRE